LFTDRSSTVTLRGLAFVNDHATRGGDVCAEDDRVRFVVTPILSGIADYDGGLSLKNCAWIGLCASDADMELVTCTLTLEGATLPVTSVLNVVVTTTETYTDVLVNTALARSAARDDAPQNNGAEATVGVGAPPCVPLEEVTIEAPAQVYSGTAATFTANISPSMATSPTVYVWRPQPDGSAILPGRSVATYTWPTTGTQVITVTAANCGGEGYATNSYTVTVRVEEKHIYLPVVMRNA
jgi:hypothetical protein